MGSVFAPYEFSSAEICFCFSERLEETNAEFVGNSLANPLHSSGEHSGDLPTENVTTSNPSCLFCAGWIMLTGIDVSESKLCHILPVNSIFMRFVVKQHRHLKVDGVLLERWLG